MSSVTQIDPTRHRRRPQASLAQDLAAVVEAVAEMGASESTHHAAVAAGEFISEMVASKYPKELQPEADVYIGLATHQNAPKLIANCGNAKLDNDFSAMLESAMLETKTRQRTTLVPYGTDNRFAALCHRTLLEHASWTHALSFELKDTQGQAQGVVLVGLNCQVTQQVADFCEGIAIPLGAAMDVVNRAQSNHLGRIFDWLRKAFQRQKLRTFAVIASVVIGLGLIPLPYMVYTDCEIQPEVRRFVSAPFDAKLDSCSIQPGDLVEEGSRLANLDAREIKLELAEVEAELYRAKKDLDGFVANHESGEASLARLKVKSLAARQELLRYRYEHLNINSPISGMVVSGDLKDAKGMALSTGDAMFEIAKLERLRFDLMIPSEDVHLVQPGASVWVHFDSLPFERFEVNIERISPAAELRDDKNVFLAKATIENQDYRLRPGMRGEARIRSGIQPLMWHYLRKPVSATSRWFGW